MGVRRNFLRGRGAPKNLPQEKKKGRQTPMLPPSCGRPCYFEDICELVKPFQTVDVEVYFVEGGGGGGVGYNIIQVNIFPRDIITKYTIQKMRPIFTIEIFMTQHTPTPPPPLLK